VFVSVCACVYMFPCYCMVLCCYVHLSVHLFVCMYVCACVPTRAVGGHTLVPTTNAETTGEVTDPTRGRELEERATFGPQQKGWLRKDQLSSTGDKGSVCHPGLSQGSTAFLHSPLSSTKVKFYITHRPEMSQMRKAGSKGPSSLAALGETPSS
jgi:hypothetical protein